MEPRRGESAANNTQTGSNTTPTGFSNTSNSSISSSSGSARREAHDYAKKLSKFYTSDRPPRKRLRNVLDFLRNPISQESGASHLVGMAVTALTGGSTTKMNLNALHTAFDTNGQDQQATSDTNDSNTESDSPFSATSTNPMVLTARRILKDFWGDPGNASILFLVVNDCVNELESMYNPHENGTFRKMRQKKQVVDVDDWSDVFEGLEILVRHNQELIRTGWKKNGFIMLFLKLLKRDNHAIIKKYAFRCLALYTDAMRSMAQFRAMETQPSAAAVMIANHVAASSADSSLAALDAVNSGGASVGSTASTSASGDTAGSSISRNTGNAYAEIGETAVNANGAQFFQSLFNACATIRPHFHLDLLRESIDFSPFAGTSNALPEKFINDGVYVEGWLRPTPALAEEPVDMLRFLMDLSLEKDRPSNSEGSGVNSSPSAICAIAEADRFEFWCEIIMRFYMPYLYPKVCHKVGFKEESDMLGFFHHCPGSFQRVVARWFFKLRAREDCMEIVWSKREFAEIIMETFRQRFMYRDSDLIMDAIRFYGNVCMVSNQYIPKGMKQQMNESIRAMISHVSQLFHPSVQLEDTKLLLHCIDLLEIVAQHPLDEYTSMYLRKFVLSTIDNCPTLRDANNGNVTSAMLSIVFHVWMHSSVLHYSNCSNSIWMELNGAVCRWLTQSGDLKFLENEVIACWRRELRFTSCLLMYLLDDRYGNLRIANEGAVYTYSNEYNGNAEPGNARFKDPKSRQGYIQSAAAFLSAKVQSAQEAMILLDRVLHLISASTMSILSPILHYNVLQGLLQLIELWIDTAIAPPIPLTRPAAPSAGKAVNPRSLTRTSLQSISPSTLIALFGEWFIPACEAEASEMINARCVALVILCKLCTVRSSNPLSKAHGTLLVRVLFRGITASSGLVVSTILQQASRVFALNLEGLNILIPSFLYTIDRVIIQNICDRAEKQKSKNSEWSKELQAALEIAFSLLAFPKQYPSQDVMNWKARSQMFWSQYNDKENHRDHKMLHSVWTSLTEQLPEMKEPCYVILGRIFVRIRVLPFKNIASIQQRALWGLHAIIAMNLTIPQHDTSQSETQARVARLDSRFLHAWIIHILDAAQTQDFTTSMTALSILQDLATDYCNQILELEPGGLVERIVMTLAVFAQQQVEEASFQVQAEIEKNAMDPSSNAISSSQESPGRDSSKQLKPKVDSSMRTRPTSPPHSPGRDGSSNRTEPSALKLIFNKTLSIFDCLRVWVTAVPQILLDDDVKTILFDAIEAALIGVLPGGEWQREVEKRRIMERRLSIPLLFVGLQMRASLDNDASAVGNSPGSANPQNHNVPQTWLQCFEETAIGAEGLLLHLLHHLNGFSSSQIDQVNSKCTEWGHSEEEKELDGTVIARFVLMDAILVTVLGTMKAQTCRFIARDMTGLFTWDIAPAGEAVDKLLDLAQRKVIRIASDAKSRSNRYCQATSAVRLEGKSCYMQQGEQAEDKCVKCGYDKVVPKVKDNGLQVAQISWDVEKRIMGNNICSQSSSYAYHESAGAISNGESSAAKQGEHKDPRGIDSKKETPRVKRICKCKDSTLKRTGNPNKIDTMRSICGLFDIRVNELNIGSLDHERCLLDLVLDSIPILFRDCSYSGDVIDKTLLGGRYAAQKYQYLELFGDHETEASTAGEKTIPHIKMDDSWLLRNDASDALGFSFIQRLTHDEECFAHLRNFLTKNFALEGKDIMEFCDAVKRYERTTVPNERVGQACVIYWEFFSMESPKKTLHFPPRIAVAIQKQLQNVQKAFRSQDTSNASLTYAPPAICLPGDLFLEAITYIDQRYMKDSGFLERFVSSLEYTERSSPKIAKRKENTSAVTAVPSQLLQFDEFSIMEINVRVAYQIQQLRLCKPELLESAKPKPLRNLYSKSFTQESRANGMDIARLFFSQSGILPCFQNESAVDPSHKPCIKLLQEDSKLERSIMHLDKTPTRETMKIGVLYVGPTQRTQQEILANSGGTSLYEEFLHHLGRRVHLLRHQGFTGGLDCNPKSLSNGEYSFYYANAQSEIMYHVVTCMPTRKDDAQQIDKKRHVGNDFVHIIWNENDHVGYAPGTITSHFNDVQIVIYPLRKAKRGSFLIKIFAKEKLQPFGPLQSEMVVHGLLDLATLVRQTAMNANRVCRAQSPLYMRPFPTRKKLVEEIIERYAVEYSDSKLLHALLATQSKKSDG